MLNRRNGHSGMRRASLFVVGIAVFSLQASLLARLDRLDAVRGRLAEILGAPVDVIEETSNRTRIQKEIDRDRVLAF